MQQIRLTFSSDVIKFLAVHLTKDGNQILLDQRSSLGKKIMEFIQKAPNGFRASEDFNIELTIKDSGWMRRKKDIDVRSCAVFINSIDQQTLNVFFKKFIKMYFCMWVMSRKRQENCPEEKDLIDEFKKMYDFSEDDISSHSLHVAYWRFRHKVKQPEEYLLKNFGLTL